MGSEVRGEYTGARQRVVFGVGSRSRLGDELAALEIDRALLVTGPTVAASGLVDAVISLGGSSPVGVAKAVALGLADPGFADGSRPLGQPAGTSSRSPSCSGTR